MSASLSPKSVLGCVKIRTVCINTVSVDVEHPIEYLKLTVVDQ
jgi:hypothetical protein